VYEVVGASFAGAFVVVRAAVVDGVAQACVLHDCDVDGFEPEQDESDTLWPSERLHVTERVWVPPPQDAEQDPHEPVVYEYVAQACVLHDCDVDGFEPEQDESDTLCPSERLQVTERVDVPPPQDAEHDDHEPVVYEYVYDAGLVGSPGQLTRMLLLSSHVLLWETFQFKPVQCG